MRIRIPLVEQLQKVGPVAFISEPSFPLCRGILPMARHDSLSPSGRRVTFDMPLDARSQTLESWINMDCFQAMESSLDQ